MAFACFRKNAAQSASDGWPAFFKASDCRSGSRATSSSAPGSNSRAKDTAKKRSRGQRRAKHEKSGSVSSSPSRLSSSSDAHEAEKSESRPAKSNRKQPSSCKETQEPLRNTDASESNSQCRTSLDFLCGSRTDVLYKWQLRNDRVSSKPFLRSYSES